MMTPFQSVMRFALGLNCRRLNLMSLSCPSTVQRRQFRVLSPGLSSSCDMKWPLSKHVIYPSFTACDVRDYAVQKDVHHTGLLSQQFTTSSRNCAKVLSEKGDIVYKGAISGMIKGVKIFSLSTSVIGICLQPMLLFSNQELPTGFKFAIGGFLNFFVFMNPLIIHYIAKKYVTELCWNSRTGIFTATTWSFFLRRKELQFTAEDVKVPDVPGMFTFLEAKGVPLFFDPQAFEDSEAYIHLMGYDKPLDWELPLKETSKKDDSQNTQ